MNRLLFALAGAAGVSLLSGCSLFGMGPSQHTVVDYESLEPGIGHGADYDEQTRYGRVSTTKSRTGLDKPGYTPDYRKPDRTRDDVPHDTPDQAEQD
jgi:hypothetical protein